MATNKNITMKQFNGIDYDTLYPKTLSEQSLVSSTVKDMFDLTTNDNVEAVLQFLGRFNEHCWKRRTATKTINKEQITTTIQVNQANVARTIQYGNDIDAGFVLSNPQTINIPASIAGGETLASLAPCYIRNLYTDGVYYLPEGTTFDASTGVSTIYYNTSENILMPYGNPKSFKVTSVSVEVTGDWELVFSTNRNAYPDSGVSGGYEYEYLGVPFDKLPTAPQFAIGSYVGTGTYGSDHPNSIVCPFVPKFIWVVYRSSSSARLSMLSESKTITLIALEDVTTIPKQYFGLINGESDNNCYGYKSDDGKTFFWYQTYASNYPARYQLNELAYTYRWIAIG